MANLSAADWLNFWRYYADEDHQQAAVQMLYEQMPESLLQDDSSWVLRYRTKPEPVTTNPIEGVPYQSQNDNASGTGYRECFSSSCAMVAMFYGKIANDDAYNKVRSKYGDSTDAQAQLRALRSLGLNANFKTDATIADLEKQIDLGRPTPCGWLHHGPASAPSGGGHYSVVIGYNDSSWIHHDPNGEANLGAGGYTNNLNGESMVYSRKNWTPRWIPEGDGSGWMMIIHD